MTSDLLFILAVERLPMPLASAMIEHALTNPAVLSYYPRKSAEELGLVPVDEAKVRKVTEGLGVVSTTAYLVGTGIVVGIGSLIGSGGMAATGVDVVVTGTASCEEVPNLATGAAELVPNREVDDVSQLPHATHPHARIHIHHFHADTARIALPLSVVLIHTSSLPNATPSAPDRRALKIGAVGSTVDTCSPSHSASGLCRCQG